MLEFIGPFLQPIFLDFLRVSLWLAILVVIFVPLERLFAARSQHILRKAIGADLCYFFLSSLIPALLLSFPIGLVAWAAHSVVPDGVRTTMAGLPIWASVLAGLMAGEIGYYWGHRWSHEIPFLWSFHAVHHSAEEIDFLVHTRNHPLDLVFNRFCALAPLYVLGLSRPEGLEGSLVPVIVTLIGTAWGFFIHANLRWRFGPLEWLVSTPAFHHWHHTRTGAINRNYASMLPWLDWIFGTFHLPKVLPETYGIEAKMPESLIGQLAYPLRVPTEEPQAAAEVKSASD